MLGREGTESGEVRRGGQWREWVGVGVGVETRDEHRDPKPEHGPWGPVASGSDFPAGKVAVFLLRLLASWSRGDVGILNQEPEREDGAVTAPG